MSHSTSNNVMGVYICPVCNLTFETSKQLVKQNLSGEHLKVAREDYEEKYCFEDKGNAMDTTIDKAMDKANTITNDKAMDNAKTITKDKAMDNSKAIPKDKVVDNTIKILKRNELVKLKVMTKLKKKSKLESNMNVKKVIKHLEII